MKAFIICCMVVPLGLCAMDMGKKKKHRPCPFSRVCKLNNGTGVLVEDNGKSFITDDVAVDRDDLLEPSTRSATPPNVTSLYALLRQREVTISALRAELEHKNRRLAALEQVQPEK